MGMGMMSFGLLMMFVGLLVVAGVIAIVAWGVIYFAGAGRSRGGQNDQARQILDQRYAKGEIGEEEYRRIRRELG
ncbi:MAG TPA: SHOCT domain-containing protein [Candidatus Dormibacteraeota bacterium]|nr:SHOCT domain-containing protein [Candidatus Dormibacteraeota bacterium]